MRIFLTGATGYIGSAVLDALLKAGHQVTALVRDNEKAARISAKGAYPVVGSLADPESYRPTADAQDGYIHTAFDDSGEGVALDRTTIESLLAAARRPRTSNSLSASPRFFIYTSGIWVVGRSSEPTDESAELNPIALAEWRVEHDAMVLAANSPQLRTAVVRPGVVYGGAQGLMGDLFKMATNGLVRVVGDGNNHWPAVYDHDLADLYVRIAGNDEACGVFNANDEGDESVNDIVSAISPYLAHKPDVRYVPIDEARSKMGPFADALALDQIVRSTRSRAIGWNPSVRSVAGNAARLLEEWRAARA
ncbi:MAG: NAD-dependent epimerase/dehydratase family protein [Vicinamibacterales bacterium]